MIKIVKEINICEFEAWSGAKDTLDNLDNCGKLDELQELIESMDYDSWTETELNDFLWFEEDYIYECLGIEIE